MHPLQAATYTWNGSVSGTWQTGVDQANWDGNIYAPGNGGGNLFQFTSPDNTRTTITLTGAHNPNVNNLLINGNTPLLTIAINAAIENSKLDLTALSEGATTITVTGGSTTIQSVGNVGANLNSGLIELQSFNTQTWDIQGTSTLTINSAIRGTGSGRGFIKIGTGTLVLGGENLYTGKTAINGGILSIDDERRLGPNPSAAADHFSMNGGTLQTTATFSIDDANRGLSLGTLGGTFQPDAGTTLTVTKVIAGTGRLTKTGGGTLALNAANTYTSGTLVSSGELIVANTAGSATGSGSVQVSGGVLRGTGFMVPAAGGTIKVAQGALLSIGLNADTAGKTLTLGSATIATATTLQTGSTLEFDLFTGAGLGNNTASLTAADRLRWAGTFSVESGVTLKVNNPNGMTAFAENDSWKLLDWTTLTASAPTGNVSQLQLILPTLSPGLSWDLSQLYTHGIITIMVPEPSRLMLCLTGLGLITFRRQRRA